MRWEALFDDLQGQASALAAAEVEAEVSERARIEGSQLTLLDRLGAALQTQLRLSCQGNVKVSGRLSQVGPDWLLVDEGGGREALVRLAAVHTVAGIGRLSKQPDSLDEVGRRLGLRSVLRAIARDRSGVRIHLGDGSVLDGTIDRVGTDFCELALHEAGQWRRRAEVREVSAIVLEALSAVRRDGG